VEVLVEQYAGKESSKRIYPEWRGGYYYAARPKNDAAAPLGLLYVSRWSSAEKAAEFAAIYARSLGKRYNRVEEKTDPDPKNQMPQNADHKDAVLKGRHIFQTEEGAVLIEEQGDMVVVSESLDAATTATVEKELLGARK